MIFLFFPRDGGGASGGCLGTGCAILLTLLAVFGLIVGACALAQLLGF